MGQKCVAALYARHEIYVYNADQPVTYHTRRKIEPTMRIFLAIDIYSQKDKGFLEFPELASRRSENLLLPDETK